MNANDAIDSKVQIFLNHGWSSLRYGRPLEASKTYRTYVKMQNIEKTTFAGDVYIFDGEQIIAVYSGVKVSGTVRYHPSH